MKAWWYHVQKCSSSLGMNFEWEIKLTFFLAATNNKQAIALDQWKHCNTN